ncbi:MAG: hypothetical protein FJ088_11640, partial [Deltaproteobacteria bacterium]|nr:hypothetical protein [Deltaproteobacteria bacterium]
METYNYIFVWDEEKGEVVVSYFVVKSGMKPEDFPRDTSNGGVPESGEKDFTEILKRTYPSPKYRICGGYASTLSGLVGEYFALVDKDYDFEGDSDYLCVWSKREKKLIECYKVTESPDLVENLKTVSRTDKDPLFDEG